MFRASTRFALAVAALSLAFPAVAQDTDRPGIVLLAHGGQPAWNDHVLSLVASLDQKQPTEVAFGMASRPAIQSAVDRLVSRQVTRIVAVPLFVSSHSSVVTSTEFLLGLRQEMPRDLAVFAKMNHGAHGGHAPPQGSAPAPAAGDNTRPVSSPVPIRMTQALNRHEIVGEILADRAKSISTDPSREAVVLVAHGPSPDEDNLRWLEDMSALAAIVKDRTSFDTIDYLTVRDDAPAAIRDAASAELRERVGRRTAEGRRVLVVPLLLSYGGIEKGIQKRLEGLAYTMSPQGLMPDDRLAAWVIEMAAGAPGSWK
jgi:sirohydrochlorin ferrochelatase